MEKINVCVDKIQRVRGGRAGGPYNDFSTHKSQPKKQIGIKIEKLIFSNRDF